MVSDEKLSTKYAIFRHCNEHELDFIKSYLNIRFYRKDEVIYYANDPSDFLYLIDDGFVELSYYNEYLEKDQHVATLIKGDSFGIGEVYFENYYLNARALSDCRLYTITKDEFIPMQLSIPVINQYVIKTLSHIVKENFYKQSLSSSKAQFNSFLYYMIIEYGRVLDDIIMVPINHCLITHEKIASTINVSREQVSRLFSEYSRSNIIVKKDSYYIIDKEWFDEQKSKFSGLNFRRSFLVTIE